MTTVSGLSLGVSLMALGLTWLAGSPAQATVILTQADIEAILNRVELIPQGQAARMARRRDLMTVGDTLRTAAQAQAQLRFNDGSLARVGERATFQFLPNTRNFRLSNGTMLLLIPPGRGRSTIQTPSAITGIQGSAVVVRHVEDRNLTVVMALTNNPAGPMTVTIQGCDGAGAGDSCVTEYDLYAGQMALVQDNQVQILEFDLPTFYDTSPLVNGLELNNPDPTVSIGAGLDAVRGETLEALSQQPAFGEATVLDPAIFALDPSRHSTTTEPWLLSPAITETQVGGQPNRVLPGGGDLGGVPLGPILGGSSPAATPAAAQPPVTQPPGSPPMTQPPTRPQVPASPPPFRDDSTVPANPPAQPPVIFQP